MATALLFGTAGIPISSPAMNSAAGVERVAELKLGAMELEFVRGVHMGEGKARALGRVAERKGVLLRVHAPYFINLNSKEKAKVEASRKRIIDSARAGEAAGARIVTFHPGFFQGQGKEDVLKRVTGEIAETAAAVRENGWKIRLAPETTGKGSQVGSLQETLEMCRKVKGVLPMVDWSHLHARENGRFRKKGDFLEALDEIPAKFLKNLQMHASGIRYSEKGERNHLNFQDRENDFNYRLLLEAVKEKRAGGCIICESPSLERDALLMKGYWERL